MKVDEVFEKVKPILGARTDQIWREFVAADASVRRDIEIWLRLLLARSTGHGFQPRQILLEPPPPQEARGPIQLGTVHYGDRPIAPFGLRPEELIQHVGIFGRSGAGKTNVSFLVLRHFLQAGTDFLVFDWKRNYRDLLPLPGAESLRVFTVGRDVAPFHFNPLAPPEGTSPTVWLKKLIEIVCHAYFLGEGVAYLLQEALDAVYRESGAYDGSGVYPRIANVARWLRERKVKGRSAAWMESALRAVAVLCFGEVGRVLNEGPETRLEDLLEQKVILELDALTNTDKTFLIESLLLWIHHYRLAQGSRETFKHAIVIEEAHHVLLRKKQEATGEEAVTDVLLREIRELGEGVILLDQHPSLISKPALGNTYCSLVLNLKHRSDLAMIADSLLLKSEQARHLGHLEVGWGVAKLQGRWFRPFLVKFDHLLLEKGAVSDDELRQRMKDRGGSSAPMKPKSGSSEVLSDREGTDRLLQPADQAIQVLPETERTKGRCAIRLTTKEEEFLKDVSDDESRSVTERLTLLRLSPHRGCRVQTRLRRAGLIELHSISFSKGRRRIATLTDRARAHLGLPPGRPARHGSPEHRYWVARTARLLERRGFAVTVEHPLGGGRSIDLLVQRPGRRIGIEVETGASDIEANLAKSESADLDELWLLATRRQIAPKIQTICDRVTPTVSLRVMAAEDLENEMKEDR